jgi:hypothetical protein
MVTLPIFLPLHLHFDPDSVTALADVSLSSHFPPANQRPYAQGFFLMTDNWHAGVSIN